MSDFRINNALVVLLIGTSVSGLAGCGDGRPMGQVRGRVIFTSGKSPEAGVRVIRLECAADTDAVVRKGATGIINDDGTFEIFTRRPGDGVHLGKYDVTLLYCRSSTDQRPMIPVEYTKSATTPFHVVIDGDEELQIEIGPESVVKNTN